MNEPGGEVECGLHGSQVRERMSRPGQGFNTPRQRARQIPLRELPMPFPFAAAPPAEPGTKFALRYIIIWAETAIVGRILLLQWIDGAVGEPL